MRQLFCNVYNLKVLKLRATLGLFTIIRHNILITRCKSEKMKFLNVAEKNDAAKNIAAQLSRGASTRREGLSQYNKIYEFEAEVLGQRAQMVMTSVSGHLLGLEFVGTFKHWQSCSPLQLFDAPVFKYCPENYDKIKKTLEREIRSCQGLIIWTDCDREGENIGFEIIDVCKAVKSNLSIYRAKFSEITFVSVQRALRNLEQPNKNISDAVDVRQELDLRIGAAFTRFQTLRLQRVFPTKLADSLVSYGSCQFPTLGFVVERYRAVENFVAEPFWKIKVNHTINNLSVEFNWARVRLFDRDVCQVFHDICLDSPQAKVTDVRTKPKSKWRPLPLDTVELEKLGSRKLKINAKETMRLAEKLYTQGFISYPRTETNEFPKEMNLGQLVQQQTGDPNWGAFAQGILDQGGPNPRQGNKSDKAHPPIHPTKYAPGLSGNEQRLYEFIVRSFLACCSKDAQGQETTVSIDVAGEKFTASGLMITARNYLEVYPYDKWSSKEIHVYENGQTFDPTSIDMLDGSTSPPNLLTEADLIALMEKHGIGTDATHAEHIETIKSRSYVALADAIHFVPGLLGMGLVEGYDAMGLTISKPHLRAQLEADLKAISEGRKNPQVVLAEQIAKYKEVYQTVSAEASKIDAALAERFSERPLDYRPTVQEIAAEMPSVLKCPKCGSDMVVRTKKNNADEYYIGCNSFPNCKNAVWLPSLVRSVEVLNETCESCGPTYKKIKFQWRNNTLSHIYPSPHIACIGGCDPTLLELLQVNLSNVKRSLENTTQAQVNRPPQVPQPSTNTVNRPNNTRQQTENTVNRPNNTRQQTENTVYRPNNTRQQTENTVNRPNNTRQQTENTVNRPNNTRQQIENNVNRPNNTRQQMENTTNNNPLMSRQNTINNPFNTARQISNENRSNSLPNQTRQFLPTSTVNRGQNAMNRMPTPGSMGDSDDNNVTCACNQPAILLTVRKQNANFGKKFYKCPLGKENGGCDFFLWAPENLQSDSPQNNFDTPPTSGRDNSIPGNSGWGNTSQGDGNTTRGWGIAPSRDSFPPNDDNVSCNCGLPGKKIIVHKEGPNKGRPFYSCPKEFSLRCDFFQWADGAPSSGGGEWGVGRGGGGGAGYSRGRGRGRGGGGRGGGNTSSGDGSRAVRKCSVCRQEGHTKSRCPNAANSGL